MKDTTMEISGIPVTIIRKKIKNLYIRIKIPDGEVKVSVPEYTSRERIEEFIEKHQNWIEKKRAEILSQSASVPTPQYKTGEIHYLWGEPYELVVERSLKRPLTELRTQQGKRIIYMRTGAKSTEVERRKQLDNWYKEEIKKVLPEWIDKYETIVGKKAEVWTFRRMKSRWGSCHVQKKKICLNIQLAEKPPACLEYVVVHELTHLHEAAHNKRFWQLVGTFLPEYRKGRELLKRYS